MSAVGIIPARFRASRFPGKPLATIAGRPMIAHVIAGARRAKRLREVVVATDDERIAAAAAAEGAPVVMTSAEHPTGTDRLAEAAADLDDAIVVNVQGDEPLIEGFVIDALVEVLESDPEAPMATLAHPLEPSALEDPNRVKLVLDRRGRALYFSRSAIPARRQGAPAPQWLQHIGLYAYRKSFLQLFPTLEAGAAERAEGLEQLRALEHGFAIRCAVIEGWQSCPVDVPEDVPAVEAALAQRGS
jgi:3-deoxy-manno-octulosonate cytidylyltransferase (CMP-KDO synthetase)